MTEERRREHDDEEATDREQVRTEPGEPGRTPGQAEGDRETVEQSLEEKDR